MKKTGAFFLTRDSLVLGIIIGLIAPLLGLVILYNINFPSITFGEFIEYFISQNRLITSLGSLSLLANVIFFTIYINTRRDKTAMGIFSITLVYGIGILLLKLWN